MDSQIEEIKAKTDIVQLIGQTVKLTRAGRNFKGLCPFHGERTPSFTVSPERGTWRCFGCGEHGDAISFLEKQEGLTFRESLEQLAAKAGVELQKLESFDRAANDKQRLYDALRQAAEFYHYLLTRHAHGQAARDYLSGRHISDETIKVFTLGFAPSSWQSLGDYLRRKGFTDQELERAGLTSRSEKGRGYDKFRNRLMFPVTDPMGRVVGFSGRSLSSDDKGPKYLNSSDNDLFHKGRLLYGLTQARDGIRKRDRLVLVEGNVDVLSSWQSGVTETVAPLGTALTPDQVNLAKRFTQKIILAFDSDKAGQSATRRSVELLRAEQLEIRVAVLPQGKDPDELINHTPKAWKQCLDQAIDVFDYYLKWVSQAFDIQTETGQRRALQEIVPLIKATPDSVNQGFVIEKTSKALLLGEAQIRRAMATSISPTTPANEPKNQPANAISTPRRAAKQSRQDVLSSYIISTILTTPSQDVSNTEWLAVTQKLDPQSLSSHFQGIWDVLLRQLRQSSLLNLKSVEADIPDSDKDLFDRLSLGSSIVIEAGGVKSLTDSDTMAADIPELTTYVRQAVRQLNELYLKDRLDHLSRQLKQAEVLGQDVGELKQQVVQVSKQLVQQEQ